MPPGVRPVFQYKYGGLLASYQDVGTGAVQDEDPRLSLLLEEMARCGLITKPTIGELRKGNVVGVLKSAGIDLQQFVLV